VSGGPPRCFQVTQTVHGSSGLPKLWEHVADGPVTRVCCELGRGTRAGMATTIGVREGGAVAGLLADAAMEREVLADGVL
jgi:hypothetical protein